MIIPRWETYIFLKIEHTIMNMKYENAVKQLEEIVRKMQNDEFDIDEIAEQLKTAQKLLKFCKDKLTKTEQEVQKIQSEDE